MKWLKEKLSSVWDWTIESDFMDSNWGVLILLPIMAIEFVGHVLACIAWFLYWVLMNTLVPFRFVGYHLLKKIAKFCDWLAYHVHPKDWLYH